jgi:hypothetical protein
MSWDDPIQAAPLYFAEAAKVAMTGAERQRRYRQSGKEALVRTKYRRTNGKWTTDAKYLSRPFIAWDGEGVTGEDGIQRYVLLANSLGEVHTDPEGIRSKDILEWVSNVKVTHPDAINIGFGFGYDINCWFADFSRTMIEGVAKHASYNARGYKLRWRHGKSLWIGPIKSDNESRGAIVYDILPFFQCSFVTACDKYLGNDWEGRDLIIADKQRRSGFTPEDLPQIIEYNRLELVNLVRLANELRTRLNKVKLRPARWDGPGAVATALMRRERIKDAMAETPSEVARAARFAYAGGRAELFGWGTVKDRATFESDKNSAYPEALRLVPDLTVGVWAHSTNGEYDRSFALYHITYHAGHERAVYMPQPFFCRNEKGMICYPPNVTGWYWGPEVEQGLRYVELYGGTLEIHESWQYCYEDLPEAYPFRFIPDLYAQRQTLKATGDGAHEGIKLGLNSLYGKLAQQVGWKPATEFRPQRIPPYHQLEWAGFVTSHCRAGVFGSVMPYMADRVILGFATDAVFTIDIAVDRSLQGTGLGQFDVIEFSEFAIFQSGLYFGTRIDGKTIERTRGVDRGSLTYENVKEALRNGETTVRAKLTRFVGARLALAQDFSRWRHWETTPKELKLGHSSKRMHEPCDQCLYELSPLTDIHWMHVPFTEHLTSCEFPIEWINPNPEMTELTDLREQSYEDYHEYTWE